MDIRRRQPSFPRRARERGVILLVALIFLILLTLLAIGASSGSLLQQRMVAATRSAQLATMSGDTALRGAEWRIWTIAHIAGNRLVCLSGSISADGCVKYDPESPLYATGGAVTRFRTGNNAWLPDIGQLTYKGSASDGFTAQTGDYLTANLATDPQYLIEDLGLMLPATLCESGVTGCNSGGPGQPEIHIYRITARATGGNENTVRVVQSTFDAQPGN